MMNACKSQRGSVPLLLLIVTGVMGLSLGVSIFFNIAQRQQAAQDKKLLQGELADLRYQRRQDEKRLAGVPSTEPGPIATPESVSPTPAPTPAVLGTRAVALPELGVSVTASEPIADLAYTYERVSTLAVANFTTDNLVAKYPGCTPGEALGLLVRRPKGSRPATSASKLIKSLGAFNFYYVPPKRNCGPDAAGKAAVSAAQSALLSTVLPTLAN